jgi:ABC-type sugar transport system ATPase subunit
MRTLFGDIRPTAGEISLRGTRYRPLAPADAMAEGIFLIPEDRGIHGLMLAKSITENVALIMLRRLLGKLGLIRFSAAQANARQMMRVLDIRASSSDQTAGELSGGNQQKVVLAKALSLGADVLLLDEPTFGVDIGATHEIISNVRAMAEKGATVLWTSSDLLEVTHVADRIIVLRDGIIDATIGPEDSQSFSEDALMKMMQRKQFHGSAALAGDRHASH